jgi:hypothetical protein
MEHQLWLTPQLRGCVTVHGVRTLRVPRALSWRSSLSPCALSRHVYIRDTSCKHTTLIALHKAITTADRTIHISLCIAIFSHCLHRNRYNFAYLPHLPYHPTFLHPTRSGFLTEYLPLFPKHSCSVSLSVGAYHPTASAPPPSYMPRSS